MAEREKLGWHQWYSDNTWYASFDLPSGWSAMVVDHSQDGWPKQQTKYTIAASSTRLHIPWCREFDSLADAKRESLLRAMQLPKAPENDDQALDQFNKFSPYARSR